jgi:hypothetical protein
MCGSSKEIHVHHIRYDDKLRIAKEALERIAKYDIREGNIILGVIAIATTALKSIEGDR